MIEAMMTCVEQESGVKTGIFVPRYQDSRSGHILPALYDKSGNLTFAMSSGSLVRTETFRREGGYVDELFVGGVDFDFSLRLRSRGYLIRECTQALLLHEPSYPRNLTLFGVKILTTSNYSAMRRYYSERNRVWLRRMYMKDFPSLCLNLYWTSAKEYVKVLVGEKEKGRKLRLMLLGVLDGLAGKMGRTTRA
jgi:rhamnosyltransferase